MNLRTNRNKIVFIFAALLLALIANQFGFSRQIGRRTINQSDDSTGNKTNKTMPDPENDLVFQSMPSDFEYSGVRCILQDNKGYMWFGSVDGLIKFDGITSYLYEHNPDDPASLSHNMVNAMIEDKNRNLWIGTSIGLNLYNREKDEFILVGSINNRLSRLNRNYISSLCSDKKSLVWVGTFGDGINVYDPEKQTLHHYAYEADNPVSISSNRITCMTIDNEDNIWIGTQNGLNLFSDKTKGFIHFYAEKNNSESLSNNYITSIEVDLAGNVWVGTIGGGLNKLIKSKNDFLFKRYTAGTHPGNLSNNSVLSLDADRRGYLWIGTENGGLNRLNISTGFIDVFQKEEGNSYSLTSNSIWSVYADNEERIWIGTYNTGINVLDKKYRKFELYQKNLFDKNSLTDNDVTGFAEDSRGNVWIATDGGGICKFDPGTRQFKQIIVNSQGHNYLENNAVQAILYDSKENLWIGTWGGGVDLFNKNGVKIRNYKIESERGAGNNNIFSLYEDRNGNIWACTAGSGLFQYSAKTNTFNQVAGYIQTGILTKTSYVATMLEDSDGSLWIGTLNGLVILKKSHNNKYKVVELSREKKSENLSSNGVEVIFEDSRKRIWIGTPDNGLNLFNKFDSTFIHFQKKDGLPSNSIKGIMEDDEGFLWIMTNKGVSRFNYNTLSFTNYSREDGLNSNEFYSRSCLRAKNGLFYIGGENGFNVFYPKNIRNNHFIPPVYLTNLKINNIPAEIDAEGSPLTKNISETTEITLNHKQTSFSLDFVALNYTRSSRNQFCYKLEGFDNDWNCVGTQRSANYTNIKPGRYVFLVKGSNNDGLWNNIPAKILIIIKPPFWKTWWAILLYIILFSVLITVVLRVLKERINIKNQLKVEQLAREKEHELNELNIQFFTNISHEFRTPLSLIIAPLESLLSTAQSKIKEQLLVIYRNAERLLQLTNNLMDFRKLEEGNTKLGVYTGDLLKFITEVSAYFHVISKQRNIDFSIETTETEIQGWFDSDKLETMLLNLLSNAFKYTPDNGKIRIVLNKANSSEVNSRHGFSYLGAKPDSQFVEIAVIDNGSGIASEELPFIFRKFYQAKSSGVKKISGTGIGLALTKGLAELHHGFIRVRSIPFEETCFTLILPISRMFYSEDEISSEPASVLKSTIADVSNVKVIPVEKEELTEPVRNEERSEILVVEDNDDLRTFLVKELSREYTVTQAKDGREGIDAALSDSPDLIVSDILMPNLSGIDLCNIIKTDVRTSHIPVILLTAKASIHDQIEGIETGADAYITKPFNIQFVLAQINQLIQSRRKLYTQFSQDVYIMPNKLAENKMDQIFLQKAIDYIIRNLSDNSLSVERLADALSLSRSNVYRKIKALTGQTIIEFIRIVRLKQAIKLMETKKYTLAEIAYQTGFTSPSYFTKSFKEQYGKPPSEYLIS